MVSQFVVVDIVTQLIVTEQFDAIVRPSLLLLDDSWTHIMLVPVNPLFIATDATPSTLAWYTKVGGKDTFFSCSTEGNSHNNFFGGFGGLCCDRSKLRQS